MYAVYKENTKSEWLNLKTQGCNAFIFIGSIFNSTIINPVTFKCLGQLEVSRALYHSVLITEIHGSKLHSPPYSVFIFT